MNLALAAVAVAVGAGGVVAVSSRDLRAALNGLAVVLVGCALVVGPLPSPATLGVRIVAGLLVVAILRAQLPDVPSDIDPGSRFGWPAESLIACAAALGGIGIALGLAATPTTAIGAAPLDAATIAAGLLGTGTAMALFALGATPAALGRSGARRAVGLVIVVQAAILLRAGLAGPPGDFEQIAIVGLLVAAAVAGAALARADEPRTDEPRAESLDEAG
jgi:hypothetical protein